MSLLLVRWTRRLFALAFAAFAVTVLAVGLGARVGPALGFEAYSIRSGSMAPAMPIGALAVVARGVQPGAGDAVAYQLPNGVVVTHRVVEVIDRDDESYLRTKGDANQEPDPNLVPSSSVIGRVNLTAPLLGFLLAMLGMPIGIVSILSFAGLLIAAIWLLEDLEDALSPAAGLVVAVPSRA